MVVENIARSQHMGTQAAAQPAQPAPPPAGVATRVRRVLRPKVQKTKPRASMAQGNPQGARKSRSPLSGLAVSVSSAAEKSARFYSLETLAPKDMRLAGDALASSLAFLRVRSGLADEPAYMKPKVQMEPAGAAEGLMATIVDVHAPQPSTGCATCAARLYQDGSDDSGVSFQSPGHISPALSGIKVASHEGEHATRESAEAAKKNHAVVQKKVTVEMAFCPDCGGMYAAGGKTSITTASRTSANTKPTVRTGEEMFGTAGDMVDDYK